MMYNNIMLIPENKLNTKSRKKKSNQLFFKGNENKRTHKSLSKML